MRRTSRTRKSKHHDPGEIVERQWPDAKQLPICKDANLDNVKHTMNWNCIPEPARPKCPACGCRQIPVDCRPDNSNFNTMKEKEQRESYLAYLESFNRTCICEQSKASRIVPTAPSNDIYFDGGVTMKVQVFSTNPNSTEACEFLFNKKDDLHFFW
ncbi:unnamed protein product [Echinostoma caproni]|uniref:Uncharacterized protein n=1 Tax=Echinostoma caproni TaxID=27848 RepID=A0A183B8N0_9TREM|nr:unnamed protein product [Echinostoma caproni]